MSNLLNQERLTIHSQADMIQVLGQIHPMAREELRLLTLAGNSQLIDQHIVAVGSIPSEGLQDILRYALYDRAKAIILVRRMHTAASAPSTSERGLLRDLEELCGTLRIELRECLLIGGDEIYSCAEEGELQTNDMPF